MRLGFTALAVLGALSGGAWPAFAQPAPSLGTDASFAVLGGSAVTNTGPTRIAGNVGVSPGNTVSGLPEGTPFPGDVHRDDALARQAQKDNAAAFRDLAGRMCDVTLSSLPSTLEPNVVYCLPSASLAGPLTLNAKDDPHAVWIIKIDGSLTTEASSSVVVTEGGRESNIFWQVGTSATLGANSAFLGNLLARGDITLNGGASLSGRLLAQTGTVTLNGNKVTICCEPITLSPASLPGGTAGTPYSVMFTAEGGTGPYTFSIVSGTLPPGLTLTGGTISGTPAGCRGTYTFTVMATDVNGCSVAQEYTIEIECTTTSGIVLSPVTLPTATIDVLYSGVITASGGTPPYTFTLTCGTLPPGLSLTLDGQIIGTPTTAGTFTFGITATDVLSRFGTRCYTLVVAPVCPTLTISPATLPDGAVGVSYTPTLIPGGGSGSYTFSARREALPDGVDLPPNGTFTGVPTKAGCYTFTVIVRDNLTGCIGSRTYTICISCGQVITILPPVLPNGIVGVTYNETITATGGSGSYTFSARPAALPPSLSLSEVDGHAVLIGTPTKAGCYTFTVTVLDKITGCFVTKTYTVCFTCPMITINPPTLPTGLVNAPYPSTMLTATPADRSYQFTIVPESGLPPDMTLCSGDTVCGTPTESGSFTFKVVATDAYGCFGTRDYTIVINPTSTTPTAGNVPFVSDWGIAILTLLLALAGAAASKGTTS